MIPANRLALAGFLAILYVAIAFEWVKNLPVWKWLYKEFLLTPNGPIVPEEDKEILRCFWRWATSTHTKRWAERITFYGILVLLLLMAYFMASWSCDSNGPGCIIAPPGLLQQIYGK